jgi:hypothetical protein
MIPYGCVVKEKTLGKNGEKSGHDVSIIPGEGYLLKEEVAIRLRIDLRTLQRWMRDGIVPYIKIAPGNRAPVRFRWSDVQSHLATRFGRNRS